MCPISWTTPPSRMPTRRVEAPEMPPRLDAFAARIRAAEGEADEVVVVGHSSSSFLGIEVLDRVLARDPGFGRRGTPVSFVSIGSVIPWLGLDPAAAGFRDTLARFGRAAQIRWLDVRAPWDWLSIHKRNPLAACGLARARSRPAGRALGHDPRPDHRRRRGPAPVEPVPDAFPAAHGEPERRTGSTISTWSRGRSRCTAWWPGAGQRLSGRARRRRPAGSGTSARRSRWRRSTRTPAEAACAVA